MNILCVGAGLANASLIHFIRQNKSYFNINCHFDVIDSREHVGGNCYTELCTETDITIHKYGPHILNTNSEVAWDFFNTYLNIHPFTNRVKASTPKGIFSMPINLHTINQLYNANMNVGEAEAFMKKVTAEFKTDTPANFEEAMLHHLGKDLYNEFIYGYTKKQWGVDPKTLPASIAKRLPFRLNYNDNYYNKKYQGLPVEGYTLLFEKIFGEKDVTLNLGCQYEKNMSKSYDFIFYTGTLDQFFDYEYEMLSYRTVYWEKRINHGYFQGNAVINYTTEDQPFTRINEPIYFEPWKAELPKGESVYFTEFSKATTAKDVPYYPIRRKDDIKRLNQYLERAESDEFAKFIFHGRLGKYKYLDMDMVVEESFKTAKTFLETIKTG